jgi:hypothetical protein
MTTSHAVLSRVRPRAPHVAITAAAVVAGLMVASPPLAVAAHRSVVSVMAGSTIITLAFLAAGTVVAARKPSHPIGWMLLGIAAAWALNVDASLYTVLDYRDHRGLPLGSLAVVLQPAWAPAVLLLTLTILLFPDGRLPARWLRLVHRPMVVIGAVWMAGAYVLALQAVVGGDVRIEPGGDLTQIDRPTGIGVAWGWTQNVFFLLLAVSLVAWVAAQVPRYRRAEPVERQQLKWLMGGAGIAALAGLLALGPQGTIGAVALPFVAALPLAVGIGILRFRLYDIDRVISRTLSYALLTGLLAAVFFGLVLITTRLLPLSSPVGVAGATLAAAALFAPLRLRTQRIVDRRFNRARYDAAATIDAFAGHVRNAVDLDAVQGGLLETVRVAFQPAHGSLWVRPLGRNGELHEVASGRTVRDRARPV